MGYIRRHRTAVVAFLYSTGLLVLVGASMLGMFGPRGVTANAETLPAAIFTRPTYSSPIAMSSDNRLVWVVNPDDDSVSVISTATNTAIKRIPVGDEPQSIAVDPDNTFAYVANAADNTVSVIQIINPSPTAFNARIDESVGRDGFLTTGAEPWNIVISPNGLRVFVANSAQDTITVINTANRTIIGNVNLRDSLCNDPNRNRRFQPRGLAVSQDSTKLYVTRFLSFTRDGGVQGADDGKEGVVCRLDILTSATTISAYVPSARIRIAAQNTGFGVDANGDGQADPTAAFPNQLQSIVIRGDQAYLPNIAASPSRPLRFNVDTHAFVNVIDGVNGAAQTDASATKFLNLHLGARRPETGKKRLFFANPWAIAFTNQQGAGSGYVVSSGSDLLVKVNVDTNGQLSFTSGVSTTKYIDLNDPANPATAGTNAGKNPLGIVIDNPATRAYVMNSISRNVSVVDLASDSVIKVIKTTDLPPPSTLDEILQIGKEMFFSSRGHFDRPAGTTVSTDERLSSEGWQNCASCHFAGLTDGVIWQFGSGPRKSVPLNGTWNPHNPNDQRILNYSAIFDEVQDFELNIRNVSGPGPLSPGPPAIFNPNQGLIVGGDGTLNLAPGAVPPLIPIANGGRPQLTVTLPGSTAAVPALDALKEWVRLGVRTPNGALTTDELTAAGGNAGGGLNPTSVQAGRALFDEAGCQSCHGGGKWTNSTKDFTSPPDAAEVVVETDPNAVGTSPEPNLGQYLARFLEDIKSFELNVPGKPNLISGQPAVGAVEKDTANRDALGIDYNGDGKGAGFNPPSLLGINVVPPYYHNGACETLACVVADLNHRRAGLPSGRADPLNSTDNQRRLVSFLETLDAETPPPANLSISVHDIFADPPVIIQGATVELGANISLSGPKIPQFVPGPLKVTFSLDGVPGTPGATVIGTADLVGIDADFGQTTVRVPWTAPNNFGRRSIFVTVDSTNLFLEDNENDNRAGRRFFVRPPQAVVGAAPVVANVFISDDVPFVDNDIVARSNDVAVRFVGTDADGDLHSFCIVRYSFDPFLRRWIEETCAFLPLPTANPDGSYTVHTTLRGQYAGVAYAFVWLRDAGGNISRLPGLDVITIIPPGSIDVLRNQVRIFRVPLAAGQRMRFTFTPVFGDIDVSVFQGIQANAPRILVSAQNGTAPETVEFQAPAGPAQTVFQIEIRPAVTSRFTVDFTGPTAGLSGAVVSSQVALFKNLPDTPFVAGPPARQAALGDDAELPKELYLPLVKR